MADTTLSFEISRGLFELTTVTTDPGTGVSAVFTFNGTDIPCTYVQNENGYLNAGGIVPLDDLILTVNQRDLPATPPAIRERITFQSRQFIIQMIKRTSGSAITYTCWDPARGM